MTRASILLFILAPLLACSATALGADAPATQPAAPAAAPAAQAEPSTSDLRVMSFKSYTYVFVSTETTTNRIQEAIGQLIPKVEAALGSGQLRPSGPVIFTYQGMTADRNKRFTLEVGAIVKDGTTAPEGFKTVTVPPTQCATMLYTGPLRTLGPAIGKLYGDMVRQGLQPGDVMREAYLYFEDPDSPNNVVQIRVEIAPGL